MKWITVWLSIPSCYRESPGSWDLCNKYHARNGNGSIEEKDRVPVSGTGTQVTSSMCASCLSSSLLYAVSTANRQGQGQAGTVSSPSFDQIYT